MIWSNFMSGKNWETRCPCCGSLFSVPGYDEADMYKAVKDSIDLSLDCPQCRSLLKVNKDLTLTNLGEDLISGYAERSFRQMRLIMGRKVIDLTGQTFGNLTVIKRVEDYVSPKGNHAKRYLCQCACGNQIEVQAGNLKSGNTVACSHSCPCKKKKYKPRDRDDLSGQTFGSLTVEKRVEDYVNPKGVHSSKYLCKCVCGNQIEVIVGHLTSGHTKSCPRCILKKNDIVGKRFGKLVVKEYVETNKTIHVDKVEKKKKLNERTVIYSYDPGKWYICQCDCGNITYVKRGQLIGGFTKSCGCLKTIRKYNVQEFVVKSENFSRSDYKRFNKYIVYVNNEKLEFKTLSNADTFFKRKMIPGNQCSIKAEGEYSCELKRYDDTGLNTLNLFNEFMEIEEQEREKIKKQNRLRKMIKNISEAEDAIMALCYFAEKRITDSSSEDEIGRLKDAIGCLKRASKRMLG